MARQPYMGLGLLFPRLRGLCAFAALYAPLILHMLTASVHCKPWMRLWVLEIQSPPASWAVVGIKFRRHRKIKFCVQIGNKPTETKSMQIAFGNIITNWV
jgi:hypothetical protein